ncbi:MAG TPA: 3-keto-5-aminohexanoate cleavage protein, partial [Candidatus Latescibacteria bacterium]|nr:3-keto-5-aminohexanoate cleavage protein [Candidatus Latescibacterota bacterium]
MSKLIITVALNGSVPTKKMNPHTPITPDEIAEAAV